MYTGSSRRRRWSPETKAQIVAESYGDERRRGGGSLQPGEAQVFTWRRDAKRAAFAQVVVEDAEPEPAQPVAGVIEIELVGARVRIGREADARMAVAVIGALRAGR